MESRSKSWCYTMNNYTVEDMDRLKQPLRLVIKDKEGNEKVQIFEFSYQVCGEEVGENGTPHLQGCITFKETLRHNKVRSILTGCHIEVAKALTHARKYCQKDGKFWEVDNRKGQGNRTDLEGVITYIKDGHSIEETANEYSLAYVKYHSGLLQLTRQMQNTRPRTDKPTVSWYYGSTGTGKTRAVYEAEAEDLWITADSLTYFNGYTNQRAALFDDFRGGFCKFRELLRLLDRYPMVVNIKYGCAQWNSERLYITSNRHPKFVYDKPDEDMEQLLRRIDNIVEFSVSPLGIIRKEHKGVFRPGVLNIE